MVPQNVSSSDDYITQYEWTEKVPAVGQSISSKTFLIKNINNHNLECSIVMKLISSDTLQIRVKKGYYKPAKALITLTLGNETPITTFVEDWKDVHKFNDIPREFYKSYLPVNQPQQLGIDNKNLSQQLGVGTTNKTPQLEVGTTNKAVQLGLSIANKQVFGSQSATLSGASWGFPSSSVNSPYLDDLEEKSKMFTSVNFNGPLTVPAITIVCKIKWLGFTNDIRSSLSFQKTFENLYLKPTLSDLEIRIGNVKLPAHKIILIIWSKTFAMELATDIKYIEITNVDVDTMKEVLWYMYSGGMKPIDDVSVVNKILAAAINYDIVELKSVCVARLLKKLSIDNALEILEVAYEYKVTDLYQEILLFIKRNKATISTQKDFKDALVKNPELMYEFMMLLW